MPPKPSRRASLILALVTHPAVQLIRFGTKAMMAWFVSVESFGDLMLAGLLFWVAFQIAWFGLDEALIWLPKLSSQTWRRLRRFQGRLSAKMTLALAALAGFLALSPGRGDLPVLLLALSPGVLISGLAVLPTARLVRARLHREVFIIEVGAVLCLGLVTAMSAWLGAGAWAWIIGNHAAASFTLWAAERGQRSLPFDAEDEASAVTQSLGFGARLTGAGLLNFGADRGDGFGVGLVVGRAAMGVYELTHSCATFLLGHANHVAERCLFPTLSAEKGEDGHAFRRAWTVGVLILVPAHLGLVGIARPVSELIFPPHFPDATLLIQLLVVVSALRTLELIAVVGLKAAGLGDAVLRLAVMRLCVVGLSLGFSLGSADLATVAMGLIAARTLTLGLSLRATWSLLGRGPWRFLLSGAFGLCAWVSVFLAGLSVVLPSIDDPLSRCAIALLWASLSWIGGRLAFGFAALRATLQDLGDAILPRT